MALEPLVYPFFTCQTCGQRNQLEIDSSEGFPQCFIWDCERCCHPHEITVRQGIDASLEILAEGI